ncbi:hypothetical protein ACFLQ8_00495 [Candidatus Auribacterota bacterium]
MIKIGIIISLVMILSFAAGITTAVAGGDQEPFDNVDKAGQELNNDLTDGFGLSEDASGSQDAPNRGEYIGYDGTAGTMRDYRGDQQIRMEDVEGGAVGEAVGSSEVPME